MNNTINKQIKMYLITTVYLLMLLPLTLQADALKEASNAFSRGDYVTAVKLTSSIISQTDKPQKFIALIRRGEAFRALGHLRDSQTDLQAAVILAKQQHNSLEQAIATLSLGQLLFQQQHNTQASKLLKTTLQLAQQLKQPIIEASANNILGNILSNQDKQTDAIVHYKAALNQAIQVGDTALVVASRRNLAKVLGNTKEAKKQLTLAQNEALTVLNLYERAELLLGLAQEIKSPYPLLQKVLSLSQTLNSPKLRSQAKGQLGALYEKKQRYSEALILTEQAIVNAQEITSDDLLLKWQWQSGRLLNALGDKDAAISAYRQAVYYINTIRRDIPLNYQGGKSSFREILSPIYIGLADLLLQQAAIVKHTEQEQILLREARDTIEKIKLSELQDYFQDPCIISQTEKLETLAPHTAVLYPIILPDRLELLVSIGTTLSRYSSTITKKQLQRAVNRLVTSLRPTHSGQLYPFNKKMSMQLYQWLINPIFNQLKKEKIDTLVFVPDGVLRSLPIVALTNGKQYLLEDFAIATVPGLTLFDPNALPQGSMQILLAGLSKPGPVVLELPDAMWSNLIQKTTRSSRGLRGMPTTIAQLKPPAKLKTRKIDQRSLLERKADMDKVQQALALPGVKQEIEQLTKSMQGKVLLDDNFLLKRFSSEVAEKSYRVVHIASHGFFGGAPEQNFIMTYDRKLNMNQLGNILQPKRLAEKPIELLTLSACQTAEGDDRSPLGLAGVALKSGARSILGTLWPIADNAAQQMLPAFYDNLIQPQATKAKALQLAQLNLLKQKEFEHPFFWSPFVLIGNWL